MCSSGTLAVIPARAGSKRLPGKNSLDLLGKPLIQWTIDSALKAKSIDRVIVSTDSEEIRSIANAGQILAPFTRPANYSGDLSSSVDVVLHAIRFLAERGESYSSVMLLQPTSPLRNDVHIDEAFNMFVSNRENSVVSVCEVEHSPLWSTTLNDNGYLDFSANREHLNRASQELPVYYRLNGAIYLSKVNVIEETGQMYEYQKCLPYIMSQESSVDIDTRFDFEIAKVVMRSDFL